jgi:hypothetical protein
MSPSHFRSMRLRQCLPGTTYTATGTQEGSQPKQTRRRAYSDIWFGVTNGSGNSKPAEPLAEIHKATKSPGFNS